MMLNNTIFDNQDKSITKKNVKQITGYLVFPIILIIVCATFLFFPGLRDFTIELPNGYKLESTNSITNFIAGPDSWGVIGGDIDGYRVVNELVIGHVSYHESSYPEKQIGYFILDTESGEIQKGMTKSSLESTIRKRGIQTLPKLWRPSKFLPCLSLPAKY